MSLTVDVRTPGADSTDTAALPAEIFDVEPNISLIHQVVVAQRAAARAGTHSTKTRGMTRGGGAKPYKQKGTGRARQGSTRAPQFAGGGIVHGPQPRDHSQRLPRKMKQAALKQILTDRARSGRIGVVTGLVTDETPQTKAALATLGDWVDDGRVLLVLARGEDTDWKAIGNVASIAVVSADQLNTYDVVISDRVVFSAAALAAFTGEGEQNADS